MKPYLPLLAALALVSTSVSVPAFAAPFTLESPDIQPGKSLSDKQVFNGFGCTGGNQSPALTWKNAPAGTRSFAVTAYDPDAPTGSGWWHWVVFNLPAATQSLPANAGNPTAALLPAGAVQSRTDFGAAGYGGACPPVGHGVHHYRFTVHALKVDKLELDQNASAAMVGFMLNGQSLGTATIEAAYQR